MQAGVPTTKKRLPDTEQGTTNLLSVLLSDFRALQAR